MNQLIFTQIIHLPDKIIVGKKVKNFKAFSLLVKIIFKRFLTFIFYSNYFTLLFQNIAI